MTSQPPVIDNIANILLGMLSSAKEAMLLVGLLIIGAVIISYTIYGIYKFGVFALRLKPHYFALVMFLLGFMLIIASMLSP
jgi:hypothetical protein